MPSFQINSPHYNGGGGGGGEGMQKTCFEKPAQDKLNSLILELIFGTEISRNFEENQKFEYFQMSDEKLLFQ